MSMNLPALLLGGAGNASGFDLQGFPDVGLLNNAGAGSTKFKLKADDITFNGDVNITINAGGSSGAEGAGKATGTTDEGDVELAGQLLDMAKDADSPKEKAALIKAAIEVLGGEATQGAGGDASVPGGEDSAPGAEGGSTAAPDTFEGDALKELLSAEGGTVEEGNGGGFGVENGAEGVDRVNGEIDRGQSLTFNVPPGNAENAGGSIELGNFYRKGPDGDHVEQAKVVFRDENGKVVDEQIVQGTPDGKATVSTDKTFASVEVQPIDNGAGRSRDNSDFTLDKVTLNPAGEASGAEAAPGEAGEQQELLDMLGQLVNLIETNVEDPEQKSKLLDLVGGLMQSLLGSGAIAPDQAMAA